MAGNHRSGRKPKPPEFHVLAGTFRADRHGDPNAIKPAGVPLRPENLSADEAWCWDMGVSHLVRLGVVQELDSALLWSMCELWGLYRQCVEMAKLMPADKDVRIATVAYWGKFEVACARFGLNASDRMRLKMPSGREPGEIKVRNRAQ